MRALALGVVLTALPACIYYDPGPQPEQADAIIFYPPDARIDAPIDAGGDTMLCATELHCPEPTMNGRISVCGRIRDVETDDLVEPSVVGAPCRDGSREGACILDIEPYDALTFAGNTSTPPLSHASKYLDTCGRFQIVDVVRPMLFYLGLGVDDVDSTADDYGIGGTAMNTSPNQTIDGVVVYAITHATDAAWTAQAGLPGDSFVERGAVLMVFRDDGVPVEGVTPIEGPAPDTASDYFFSDPTATRRTIDPLLDVTGPNGSTVMINSNLVEHSGTGGGCSNWSSGLATSIRGVMFYAPRECP